MAISCGLFESNGYDLPSEKVYVALQSLDQVGIVDILTGDIEIVDIKYTTISCNDYDSETVCNMASGCAWMDMESMSHCMALEDDCIYLDETQCNNTEGCEWAMNMCMEIGGMMDMGSHTPHFIVIDETNRYWFVTAITSGYVGRYNLDTNEFIDNILVNDAPALMVLNEQNKKLYVSRMMPMEEMMMGAVSSKIQEIDYSNSEMLMMSDSFIVSSPVPHGLAINEDGSEIYVASNTADWLYKITPPSTNVIQGYVMDSTIGNSPDIVTQRLRPIQCLSINNLLFVSCSGGIWYNSFTGEQTNVPGQLQLWNSTTMTLIDAIQFGNESMPWHIINSASEERIFVVLSGDNLSPGSAGVICLNYTNNNMQIVWENYSEEFQKLHGIDISESGDIIYVSGRGDDNLHILRADNGNKIKSIPLGSNVMAAGIRAFHY